MERQSRDTACGCNRSQETDLEAAIERLAEQYRALARDVATYMSESGSDPATRSANAHRMAERLERIIGGQPVAENEFPECCLIGFTSAQGLLREWFCTGTLIHPRMVVTAKHCIASTTIGSLDPNSVAIGVEDEDQVGAGSDQMIRVSRIVNHPTEDASLLMLRRASEVAPVGRATSAEVADADGCQLVGFGNTDPGGSVGFGTKRRVRVPMMVVRKSDEDLSREETVLGFNSRTEFVAGRKGSRRDSCKGDSGGPAYVMVDGERKLAGATSRATDEAIDMCGDGGVYVRIDKLDTWIDETIDALIGG